MKVELSAEDVRNTIAFLNRTDLKGDESLTHAVLRQKYVKALQAEAPQEPGRAEKRRQKREAKKPTRSS